MKENIGNVKDVHYRYKMEQMELKVEGRGNGIKTLVTNLADVAADLKIPPQCLFSNYPPIILSYFFCRYYQIFWFRIGFSKYL